MMPYKRERESERECFERESRREREIPGEREKFHVNTSPAKAVLSINPCLWATIEQVELPASESVWCCFPLSIAFCLSPPPASRDAGRESSLSLSLCVVHQASTVPKEARLTLLSEGKGGEGGKGLQQMGGRPLTHAISRGRWRPPP